MHVLALMPCTECRLVVGDVQQEAGKGRPGNLDRNVQFQKLLSCSKQVLENDQGQELLQLSKILCDLK